MKNPLKKSIQILKNKTMKKGDFVYTTLFEGKKGRILNINERGLYHIHFSQVGLN